MMKRITIGRNPNCDIVIDQNMVSRNHALLNVYSSGKYEIINMGTNGTKVNGTPISNGQPYPVKRGDTITFADQGRLDWSLIPNPRKPWLIGGITIASLVAIALIIWGVTAISGSSECGSSGFGSEGEGNESVEEAPSDSTTSQVPGVEGTEGTEGVTGAEGTEGTEEAEGDKGAKSAEGTEVKDDPAKTDIDLSKFITKPNNNNTGDKRRPGKTGNTASGNSGNPAQVPAQQEQNTEKPDEGWYR